MGNTKQEDYSSIEKKIKWSLRGGGLLILLVFGMYFINFNGDLNTDPDKWGPFGDFIGGTLNPILAALAFYWLTASIRLQIQELRETKIELGKAAKAQEESAKHQEEIARLESENVKTQVEILDLNKDTLKSQQAAAIAQQQQIALQNFESLFFQLLKAKTDITNDIRYEKLSLNQENSYVISGKEAIKYGLEQFRNTKVPLFWDDFYRDNLLDYMGSYFRICYQIIKLIDENEYLNEFSNKIDDKNYSSKQKEYFDIFSSTITQYELEAFFYNGFSRYGILALKNFSEKYGFYKELLIENNIYDNECISKLSKYLYLYKESAFEGNMVAIEYFLDLDKIKKGLSLENYNNVYSLLAKIGFVETFNSSIIPNPSEGAVYISYSSKRINKLLKWKINEIIFNDKNIEILLKQSIPYYQVIKEIDEKKIELILQENRKSEMLKVDDGEVRDSFLNKSDGLGFIDEVVINELNSKIESGVEYINQREKYVSQIDDYIKELKQNEYTETILTVIKYNIDYFQYWDYMDWKEENQQKKSA